MQKKTTGSAAIWDWTGQATTTLLRARASKARRRGVIQGLSGVALAVLVFFVGSKVISAVVLVLSVTSMLLALASPLGGYRYLTSTMGWIGRRAGALMALVCLVPLYFFFFVPFRLLFRSRRADALSLSFPAPLSTGWVDRQETSHDAAAYERQF